MTWLTQTNIHGTTELTAKWNHGNYYILSLHGISNEHVKNWNAFVAKHEVTVNWAGIYKKVVFT